MGVLGLAAPARRRLRRGCATPGDLRDPSSAAEEPRPRETEVDGDGAGVPPGEPPASIAAADGDGGSGAGAAEGPVALVCERSPPRPRIERLERNGALVGWMDGREVVSMEGGGEKLAEEGGGGVWADFFNGFTFARERGGVGLGLVSGERDGRRRRPRFCWRARPEAVWGTWGRLLPVGSALGVTARAACLV